MPGAWKQGPAMMTSITNLVRNRRGAAAAAFALALPFMLSGLALAIDYASFRVTHTRMQNAADAAALAAIADLSLDDAAKVEKALSMIDANLPEEFGAVTTVNDITLGTYTKEGVFTPAVGADVNAARVVAVRSPGRGNAVNRIFSMFISNEALTISTVAVAARPGNVAYEPPEITVLDSTAGDFNELYAYCYNPDTRVRGEMKLIANNNRRTDRRLYPAGDATGLPANSNPANNIQNPSTSNWPTCEEAGSSVSFYLRNYRNANGTPRNLWTTQVFHQYTDTQLVNGEEFSNLFRRDDPATVATDERMNNLVETILCDTADQCNPTIQGNLVNNAEGRAKRPANVETRPCAPGKFMYYGWEDRPPSGASDRDYNDITLQLRCPSAGQLGGGKPRLVG
jgi:Flp pilus assembly protein TadG